MSPDHETATADEGSVAQDADQSGMTDGAAAFAALGLRPELCDALAALGYEEPTPIQAEAIPALLSGGDVLGLAATGTGKTAAFALPLLQRIRAPLADGTLPAPAATVAALVLVPTRELAMQVAEAVHKYGRGLGVRVLAVYGGAAMTQQLRALERGVDVVVATPGRALDFLTRGTLKLDAVRVLVLDEADEMLDMGFEEDLTAIVGATPKTRQTALFSATMAPRVARIADAYLTEPTRVEIRRAALAEGEMPKVRQTAYVVPRVHKPATLARVLDVENPTSAIVFCRTRGEVDELTESLAARGWRAEALHGGMGQDARDRVMRRFRGGQLELLVATDVAARGLDVEHVSHVVNYDVPIAADQYVHRIGRTGRAGREGVAITIAEPREQRLLRTIERVTRQPLAYATVPSVADVLERRLAHTGAAVRDVLAAARAEQFEALEAAARGAEDGEDAPSLDSTSLDAFRVVVESLSDEYEPLEIAAAAVRVAHEATKGDGPRDETEIPSLLPRDLAPARGAGRFEGRPERGPTRDRGDRGGDRGERAPSARRARRGARRWAGPRRACS
jgi:ATP-dependent RNA helicase DeaD